MRIRFVCSAGWTRLIFSLLDPDASLLLNADAALCLLHVNEVHAAAEAKNNPR